MEHAESEHNTKLRDMRLALKDGESLPPGVLMLTEHKARHALSFTPEGKNLPAEEKPLVEFRNTRFTTQQQAGLENAVSVAVASRQARIYGETSEKLWERLAEKGRFNLSDLRRVEHRALGGRLQTPILPDGERDPNGFGFVKTPTLVPGENGLSPMMTYGKVASTPHVLDDAGPSYHIFEASDRELAADKLQRGATQRVREARKASRTESLRALGIPGAATQGRTSRSTPGSGSRTTPGSSLSALSAARAVTPLSPIGQLIHRAQKMAQRGGRLHIAPGSSSTGPRPATSSTPEARPRKRQRCEKMPPTGLPASITDNLL